VYGHFGCSIPVDRIRVSIWCVALVSVCSAAKYQLCVSAKHIPPPHHHPTKVQIKEFYLGQTKLYILSISPGLFSLIAKGKKKQLG
jgi:hypothetical protein